MKAYPARVRNPLIRCRRSDRWLEVGALWLAMLCVSSCATSMRSDPAERGSNEAFAAPSPAPQLNVKHAVGQCHGQGALGQLWRTRLSDLTTVDYPIGPGDLLRIMVIGVPQLEDQEVRVSGDGTIAMPFIGRFSVAGMRQEELVHEVTGRLKVYIKDPRVGVFVKSYASRSVAIMGLVGKPGRYVLVSPRESVLQVLGQAGGITSGASEHVFLIPAGHGPAVDNPADQAGDCESALVQSEDTEVHANDHKNCVQRAVYRPSPASVDASYNPIDIDLNNPDDQACLDLPARPGDLIIVPQAGEVEVAGWVQKPGPIKIEPGMTVLSAVSAAGGAIFSHRAELLKTDSAGRRTHTSLNLDEIKEGRAADIPVKSGDLIYVKGSAVGAVPYAIQQLFGRFGTGMMIPIP